MTKTDAPDTYTGPDRRQTPTRRQTSRGGRRVTDALRTGTIALQISLTAGTAFAAPAPTAAAPVPASARTAPGRMRFGVDMESVKSLRSKGVDLSLGTFWVGSWTQRFGWGYTEQQLKLAKSQGVTPVINWWYWGDDISPTCIEQGCKDERQDVWKDKATWKRMSSQLADRIAKTMGTRETIVVLETEFNKGGVETYEPFDADMADVARMFHRKGNIKVVIGFGNWGSDHWPQFDRAVAESDYLGTQLLQSSVRDKATYSRAVDTVIAGTRKLKSLFSKPCLLIDFTVSSYPEPAYETNQANVVKQLFDRLPELKAAGLEGIVWRALRDDPNFDTGNYHAQAERHWGLVRADGTFKAAYATFVSGVAKERAGGQRAD